MFYVLAIFFTMAFDVLHFYLVRFLPGVLCLYFLHMVIFGCAFGLAVHLNSFVLKFSGKADQLGPLRFQPQATAYSTAVNPKLPKPRVKSQLTAYTKYEVTFLSFLVKEMVMKVVGFASLAGTSAARAQCVGHSWLPFPEHTLSTRERKLIWRFGNASILLFFFFIPIDVFVSDLPRRKSCEAKVHFQTPIPMLPCRNVPCYPPSPFISCRHAGIWDLPNAGTWLHDAKSIPFSLKLRFANWRKYRIIRQVLKWIFLFASLLFLGGY